MTSGGWLSQADFLDWIKERSLAKSVGALVHEDDDVVVLVQSFGVNQVAEAIKINKASIKNIEEIGQIDCGLVLPETNTT